MPDNNTKKSNTKRIPENFYAVTAKCGHVGLRYYIPVTFPVKAKSAKDAAALVREYARVKHDHKDAILAVRNISEFEFHKIRKELRLDPYMKANRKAEIKTLMPLFANRLVDDPNHSDNRRKMFKTRENKAHEAIYDKKTLIRNPKTYQRFHPA